MPNYKEPDANLQYFHQLQQQFADALKQGVMCALDRLHIEALEHENRRLSWEKRWLQEKLMTLQIPQQAVYVEGDLIHTDPSRMIVGMGYPVVYQGRERFVVKVNQDTVRIYRGSKV